MNNKKRGRVSREKRKVFAEQQKLRRSDLTPEEQIKVLDKRLGVGVGAVRERIRLNAQLTTTKKNPKKENKK